MSGRSVWFALLAAGCPGVTEDVHSGLDSETVDPGGTGGTTDTATDTGVTGTCVPGEEVVQTGLAYAALDPSVEKLAAAPVEDAETRGWTYELTDQNVSPSVLLPPAACDLGLDLYLLIRWGYVPPTDPPPGLDWSAYDGIIAVGEGEIEVVRALSWLGPQDDANPPPSEDFVAEQTDPRLVRFKSWVRNGSDGLLLRIHRPAIEPVLLEVRIGEEEKLYAFDEHLSNHSISGGWDISFGQVSLDAVLPAQSVACYLPTGSIEGVFGFRGGTAIDHFDGVIVRDGGAEEPLSFSWVDEAVGPYGNFSGTVGDDGRTVEGYYGRKQLFGAWDNNGNIVGRVIDPAGETDELFIIVYEGTVAFGSKVFARVDCSAPGAVHTSGFAF